MCHALLRDPSFQALLRQIDDEHAAEVRAGGCGCGARLHSAPYPRKPRGVPREAIGTPVTRASFCCARCRRRCTPASVRFLGRRVYLGAVVVLASALAHGFNGRRLETLIDVLAVPARTLLRWRQWWLTQFVITPFWISVRGRFMPPLAVDGLPGTLLARFERGADCGDDGPRLTRMLRFVAPLSTKTEGR